MKIGIIMGSIRDGRINEPISNWIKEVADNYAIDAEFEIVDLKDYPLPLFDEPASPAYTSDLKAKEQQQPWAEKMNELDAYIFVTPEYNHGLSSALTSPTATCSPFIDFTPYII